MRTHVADTPPIQGQFVTQTPGCCAKDLKKRELSSGVSTGENNERGVREVEEKLNICPFFLRAVPLLWNFLASKGMDGFKTEE